MRSRAAPTAATLPRDWKHGLNCPASLADDDGFQVNADHSLRAPHNSHITVLARMGIPGLLLWATLQVVFGVQLMAAYFRSRRVGNDFWCRVDIWLLVYWIAMLVNTSFDPYLEGPQGGIWFWAVIGVGMAAINLQRQPGRDEDEVEQYPAKACEIA
jgi:hypothetical protein